MTELVNIQRTRILNGGKPTPKGPVIYWMSRDQRINDNWALLYAQELALKNQSPLIVVFCVVPTFLEATIRQYDFMLVGLEEIAQKLVRFNIPFQLLSGKPDDEIPRYLKSIQASSLVTDFSPLKVTREWKDGVVEKIKIPFYEVDAHNIVPCWIASPKQEFGAYTIRPKINRLLPGFLEEFPKLKKHPFPGNQSNPPVDWKRARALLKINFDITPVNWIKAGETAAQARFEDFLIARLKNYNEDRNNPSLNGQSGLSPYFHFGQLAPQRVALEIQKHAPGSTSTEAYLEELIVRRELSDNFCFYNSNYDDFKGFPNWAQQTLNEHRKDKRLHTYKLEQFESARTHDPIWNTAQKEMTSTGKMHGYMRMYWAKKILEWTKSPEEALQFAIYLNDKYELDGRDPNGYAGVAWSIGGVHDRAWFERPIFGKIRFMNDNGLKRKFNTSAYIAQQNQPKQVSLNL